MKQWKRLAALAGKGRVGDARAAERAPGVAGAQHEQQAASGPGRPGRPRSRSAMELTMPMAVTQSDSIEDEFQQGMQDVGEMRERYEGLVAAVAAAQERAAGEGSAGESRR
ncbi:hypothetical protein CLOM_g24573 [Closterium sp. NIES-68]|nr:hypothetical protein CLOM_g24573 [Closterium sp. NIES-68]